MTLQSETAVVDTHAHAFAVTCNMVGCADVMCT